MVESMGAPICIELIQEFFSFGKYKRLFYQSSVLILTFAAYVSYHLARRPLAIVKNSLNQDCSKLTPPPDLIITNETLHNWCDWAPFDKDNANSLLGILDAVFLFAYAIFMFVCGMIAERMDLRYFLSLGMLLSGLFTWMFGLAYYFDIHSFAFFVTVQFFAGIFQSTGWPGVVTCVGNWFGKARRGLIFGIWNAHLYVGNILGAYIAGYFVAYNWGLSFIVPGTIISIVGFVLFLFLVAYPKDGIYNEISTFENDKEYDSDDIFYHSNTDLFRGTGALSESQIFTEISPLTRTYVTSSDNPEDKKAVTFWEAVKIPGVIEFSLCLFFSKLVSYTFLFWLPRYLAHATGFGSQASAYLSIIFDIGGIIGGIIAGIISDITGTSALTCVGILFLAIPSLSIFEAYGSANKASNIILQAICGALVNGPCALITTAVSAELGTHESIKSNSKALSTVTAIIDGTGSIGAAVGPLLVGLVSEYSWTYVFYIMMLADFLALLCLARTACKEADQKYGIQLKWNFPFISRRYQGLYQQIG